MATKTANNTINLTRTGYQVNEFPLYISATEVSVNTANNTSSVSFVARITSNTSSTAWTANSNTPYLQLFWDTTQIGSNLSISTMGAGQSKEITGTVTIPHNADGTKTITAKAVFVKPSANTNHAVPGSGQVTVNLALTSIANKAELTIDKTSHTVSSSSGNAITLSYTVPTGMTCTAVASYGSNSVTISNKVITNTQLLNLITTTKSATVTITLTTKNGSTTVGTSTKTCSVSITLKPTLSVSSSIGVIDGLSGKLVGGVSKAYLDVTGTNTTGSTGLTINVTSSTGESVTVSGNRYTTAKLKNPSSATTTIRLTATATDSRGNSATAQYKEATVYKYSPPTITSFAAKRCNSSGTETATGAYFKVTSLEYAHSPVGSSNSCSVTSYTYTIGSTTSTYTSGSVIALATDQTATVNVTVTDTVGNTDSESVKVNTVGIPFDIYSNSAGTVFGVGIGTSAISTRFSVALGSYFSTYLYTGGKTASDDGNTGSLLNSSGTLYLFGDADHLPTIALRSSSDGLNNIGYLNANESTGDVAINSTSGSLLLRTAGTARLTVKSGGAVVTSSNLFTGNKTAYNDNHIGNELTYNGRLYMCGTATDVPGFYFDHTSTVSGATESIRQGGMWVYAKDNATYAPATNNSAVLTTNMSINATYGLFWDKCPVARSKTTNNVIFEWVNNRIKVYIDTTMVGYMTLASS